MTRAYPYLLGACLIAIAVLGLLLGRANARAGVLEAEAKAMRALREQALDVAKASLKAAEAEKAMREANEKEIATLQAALSATAAKRPRYNARPRPADAAGHRDSILRAVRQ